LPRSDGWAEHTYELQSLDESQLHGLAERWFAAFGHPDPGATADLFTAEVARASLTELARVPLMATILSHLYALDPDGPLPAGRSEAYRDYVRQLEQHSQADSPGGLSAQIHATLTRYGPVAIAAGGVLQARSTELIGTLALARVEGSTQLAVDLLESLTATDRPPNVLPPDWRSVLTELLRHSGVFVERRSELVFSHQTIAEYLAARHVAADPQRSAQAWRTIFGSWRSWVSVSFGDQDWSYLRFIVAAWADDPSLPAALLRIARRQRPAALQFTAVLAGDGVKLAPEVVTAVSARLEERAIKRAWPDRPRPAWLSTLARLTRRDTPLFVSIVRGYFVVYRVEAIAALMVLDRNGRGPALFESLLADPLVTANGLWNSVTQEAVVPLPGERTRDILAAVATRPHPQADLANFWDQRRVYEMRLNAARRLAELGDERGIEYLTAQAADPAHPAPDKPAKALAELGNAGGVDSLRAQLASADADRELAAATALAELGDAQGADFLAGQAEAVAERAAQYEPGQAALSAIEALADSGASGGIELLASVAESPDASGQSRVQAARALAERHDPRGVDLLVHWAAGIPASGGLPTGWGVRYWSRTIRDILRRASGEALVDLGHPAGKAAIKALNRRELRKNWRPVIALAVCAALGFAIVGAFVKEHGYAALTPRWLPLTADCLTVVGIAIGIGMITNSRQFSRRALYSKYAFVPPVPVFIVSLLLGAALSYFLAHSVPASFDPLAIRTWDILNWRSWQ
jgi:hypothetical protein